MRLLPFLRPAVRWILALAFLVAIVGSAAHGDEMTAEVAAPPPAAMTLPDPVSAPNPERRRMVRGALLTSVGGLLLAAGGGAWVGLASQDFGAPPDQHDQASGMGALIGLPLLVAGTALLIPGIVELARAHRAGQR